MLISASNHTPAGCSICSIGSVLEMNSKCLSQSPTAYCYKDQVFPILEVQMGKRFRWKDILYCYFEVIKLSICQDRKMYNEEWHLFHLCQVLEFPACS